MWLKRSTTRSYYARNYYYTNLPIACISYFSTFYNYIGWYIFRVCQRYGRSRIQDVVHNAQIFLCFYSSTASCYHSCLCCCVVCALAITTRAISAQLLFFNKPLLTGDG